MRRRPALWAAAGIPLLFGPAAAGPETPDGFGGPEVTKVDWNTRSLGMADLNDDGRNDLLLVNNDRSRIEFLLRRTEGAPPSPVGRPVRRNLWEPVLEDALFRKEHLATGFPVYELAAADFNGDGRIDLAYTADEAPLSVRHQKSGGGFEEALVFDGFEAQSWAGTLEAGDLDGDGDADLLVLGEWKLLLFRQEEGGLAGTPEVFRLTDENSRGLALADIDRDGRPDLLYLVGSGTGALRVRFQEDSGAFGPERAFDLEVGSGNVRPLRRGADAPPVFVYPQEPSGLVEAFELAKRDPGTGRFEDFRPRVHPVSAGNEEAAYAYGDFDGDGRGELAVADPADSSVRLYRHDGDWDFRAPALFPSLFGIAALEAFPRADGGGHDLVVSSGEENFGGVSRMTDAGRLGFPVPLPVPGEIQAVAVGSLAADAEPNLLVVTKQGRDHSLAVLGRGEEHPSGFRTIRRETIPGVKRSPRELVLFDLDGDGGGEILLLAPREPARIFRLPDAAEGDSDSGLVELAADSSVRRTLLDGLTTGRIGRGDVDGDGTDEMIVGATGYARAVALDEEDRFVIRGQFNARSPDDEVRVPVEADVDGDGRAEWLFYDPGEGSLQRLERDESGVFRYRDSAAVGALEVVGALVDRDSEPPRLLLFGRDRFWVLPLAPGEWEKAALGSYESDLRDVVPTALSVPETAAGPPWPLVAVDGERHVIELLEWSPPDRWTSRLHFTVFEKNLHYQGRTGAPREPREVLFGDLTGDGIDDLVVLVHDRVLVYPGQVGE